MCNHQRNSLRYGITTGTCAAGAAKASAIFIQTGEISDYVHVKNLEGHEFILKTFQEYNNIFGVVKDSGDDKSDVTNGAKILAHVEILDGEGKIIYIAGEGVGTVTLPGLKVPPGEPAINPVPREMIARAIREIIPSRSIRVIISVPNGVELAKRTFNPRLGIIGGISILGTTGIVKPMNEQALLSSLTLELNMIYSLGFRELFITFAGTGENFTRKLFNIKTRNIIQCGNYPGYVIDEAVETGFEHVIICGHPGKLLKLAAGSFNTHSKIADGRFEALCTHLALTGASVEVVRRVFHSNTVNEAVEIVKSEKLDYVWHDIAKIISMKCEERVFGKIKVSVVFIDSSGEVIGEFRTK